MRLFTVVAATLTALIATSQIAKAGAITYIMDTTGSGYLGTTTFFNSAITLRFEADTNDVRLTNSVVGSYDVVSTKATVEVAGVGTAVFTDEMHVFLTQFNAYVSFHDISVGGTSVLVTGTGINNVFMADRYDLKTSYGPLHGPQSFYAYEQFHTNLGSFAIGSISSTGAFQAVGQQAIPEPSSLLLASASIVCGGITLGAKWQRMARHRSSAA